MITIEWAILWSFRHWEGDRAKRLSINWTEVVTIIGASQFSAASSIGLGFSLSCSIALTAEWFSITIP